MGLAVPVLMAIFMGTIELSRVLNIYVTANRLCRRAALGLAAPDITSSRNPMGGIRQLRIELRDPRDWNQWNPAYGPLIMALQTCRRQESYLHLDVNHTVEGGLFSLVEMNITLPPLIIPTVQVGEQELGTLHLVGRGMAMNEMQALRRDIRGAYDIVQVSIEELLAHPDDPLPELPSSRR